ncbi:MAG TPA: metal-binding protein [Cyanobacteria bacterium UBA11149]|nr:metal-binding protein [Cyanobacteria bacterium UBA11367]HBE59446.1 metal-binding protein [Cyanobacteria bacterium UBA11366]HBK65303.1 metal-binding protein [Cyanobacteria bacterium UBA11166]HBS72447.1 metal-binding protein [Cyanobacteria bacterium UBA11153]HBW89891.1 metal-binding protein [Cyanobacteria bacterium UBA11149]HCA97604.1 metal-binding protein [Cyanobacteria bacterium UBA9226]
MEAIHIPFLLKLPQHTDVIEVNESIEGLETLTPVRGRLEVTHEGNYLDVSAEAETIITLTCDRCLKQYNHRLTLNISELVWLDSSANEPDNGPLEREILLEDLVETLHPQGYFDPNIWLYEQLCLAIPPRQLCDSKCAGILATERDTASSTDGLHHSPTDRRWQALEIFKGKLPS